MRLSRTTTHLCLLRLSRRQLLLRAPLVLLLLRHRGPQLLSLLAAPLVPLPLAAELRVVKG